MITTVGAAVVSSKYSENLEMGRMCSHPTTRTVAPWIASYEASYKLAARAQGWLLPASPRASVPLFSYLFRYTPISVASGGYSSGASRQPQYQPKGGAIDSSSHK